VVARAVGALLDDDTSVPAGWLDDPAAFVAGLADRLAHLASALRDVDAPGVVAARAEHFLTSRPPLLAGALTDRPRLAELDDGTRLVRRPGSVLRVVEARTADRLRLLLGDRAVDVPAWLRPALDVVAARTELTPGDLAGQLDEQSRLVLCRRLVREGLLAPAPAPTA
jgi:hypothetical protein